MSNRIEYQERDAAFQNRLKTFVILNREHIDIQEFLEDAFHYFNVQIVRVLEEQYLVKCSTCLNAVFKKTIILSDGESIEEKQSIYITTRTVIIDFESDLNDIYKSFIVKYILEEINEVMLQGSGFTLSEINELSVQINRFEPLVGSSYIDLLPFLKNKRAIVNVINDDEMCFKYAVLSALFPAKANSHRVSNYTQHLNKLNFNGISFPVQITQIAKFEKQNVNISINVYIFNEKEQKVRPLRLTKSVRANHIHLLLLMKNGKHHYCWIKHLSRLLSSQTSLNASKKFFCDRCLNHFGNMMRLEVHKIKCIDKNECGIEMPLEGKNKIKFKSYEKQLQVPFIVYADIETLLKKPNEKFCRSENTIAYQQHEAHSVGYYFKCSYDNAKSYYRSKRGNDCIEWFVRELYTIACNVEIILNRIVPMNTTIEDEVFFALSDECHICGEKYGANDVSVRDHSHLTGEYRGSAHVHCNLNYQESRNIPIVFHNLSKYDSHFLVRKLASVFPGNITIIPLNDQCYISFTKTVISGKSDDYTKFIRLRFIDSLRFMNSSLDNLSSLLPSDKKIILHNECSELSSEQVKLMERKGVFCYDYNRLMGKVE